MKKALSILVLLMVFCFGLGAGQYCNEKGLAIPGLAMASSKPIISSWTTVEFRSSSAPHRYGLFLYVDRSADVVEIKGGTNNKKIAIYFK